MHILFITDSPLATSSYGILTSGLIRALHNLQPEWQYTWYAPTHREGQMFNVLPEVGGVEVYGTQDEYLSDLPMLIENKRPDLAITIKDPPAYPIETLRSLSIPWIALAPVDTDPPNMILLAAIEHATAVCSLTRTTVDMLKKFHADTHYTPVAIDTAFWCPGDKKAARQTLGLDENAIYGLFVGANRDWPSRKSIPKIVLAQSLVRKEHDFRMIWHANIGNNKGGVHIPRLYETVNGNKEWYTHTDQFEYSRGIGPEYIRLLYHASDFLVAPSTGEGAHIPSLEAQACGLPVLGCNFLGQADTVQRGVKLNPADPRHGDMILTRNYGYRFDPNSHAIAAHIKSLIAGAHDFEDKDEIRKTVLEYGWEHAVLLWRDMFNEVL